MPRPDDAPQDYGQFAVDLPDLRGYAGLLDTVSADLGTVATQAEVYCRNSDFGKIVETMADDYATLLPQLKELLVENETLMGQYAVAMDRTVTTYEKADDHSVASLGYTDGITGGVGTSTGRFRPIDPIDYMVSPYPSESSLPEVSFGFLFDKLAWALDKFTGFDVRAEVTDLIAGDVVDLSTQARAWELISERLESSRKNLSHGVGKLDESWNGYSAVVHTFEMSRWDTALTSQSESLKQLGTHLKDIAGDAVDTAQFVVDCIRLAIDLIASAWALQYIPIYGQAKFIQKAWDAYKRASKAVAYIKMLISALRAVKSFIVVCIDELTPSMLPAKPASVSV